MFTVGLSNIIMALLKVPLRSEGFSLREIPPLSSLLGKIIDVFDLISLARLTFHIMNTTAPIISRTTIEVKIPIRNFAHSGYALGNTTGSSFLASVV